MDWVGEPPKAPQNFWGDVLIKYQDGRAVFIEIRQTATLKQPA